MPHATTADAAAAVASAAAATSTAYECSTSPSFTEVAQLEIARAMPTALVEDILGKRTPGATATPAPNRNPETRAATAKEGAKAIDRPKLPFLASIVGEGETKDPGTHSSSAALADAVRRRKLPAGLLSGIANHANKKAATPAPMLARQLTINNDAEASEETAPPLAPPMDLLQNILAARAGLKNSAAATEAVVGVATAVSSTHDSKKQSVDNTELMLSPQREETAQKVDEDVEGEGTEVRHDNLETVMETSMEDQDTDNENENENEEQQEDDRGKNDESFATASSNLFSSPPSSPKDGGIAAVAAAAEVTRSSYVQEKLLVEGYAAVLAKHGEVETKAEAYSEAVSTYRQNREAFGKQLANVAEVPRKAVVSPRTILKIQQEKPEERPQLRQDGDEATEVPMVVANEAAVDGENIEMTADLSDAIITLFGGGSTEFATDADSPAKLIAGAANELRSKGTIDTAAAENFAAASLVAGAATAEAAIKSRRSIGGTVGAARTSAATPSLEVCSIGAEACNNPKATSVGAVADDSAVFMAADNVTMDVSGAMVRIFSERDADEVAQRAVNSRRMTLDLGQVLPALFTTAADGSAAAVADEDASAKMPTAPGEARIMTAGTVTVASAPIMAAASWPANAAADKQSTTVEETTPEVTSEEAHSSAKKLTLDCSASLQRLFSSPKAPAAKELPDETVCSGLGKRMHGSDEATTASTLLVAPADSPTMGDGMDRLFTEEASVTKASVPEIVTEVETGVDESQAKSKQMSTATLAHAAVVIQETRGNAVFAIPKDAGASSDFSAAVVSVANANVPEQAKGPAPLLKRPCLKGDEGSTYALAPSTAAAAAKLPAGAAMDAAVDVDGIAALEVEDARSATNTYGTLDPMTLNVAQNLQADAALRMDEDPVQDKSLEDAPAANVTLLIAEYLIQNEYESEVDLCKEQEQVEVRKIEAVAEGTFADTTMPTADATPGDFTVKEPASAACQSCAEHDMSALPSKVEGGGDDEHRIIAPMSNAAVEKPSAGEPLALEEPMAENLAAEAYVAQKPAEEPMAEAPSTTVEPAADEKNALLDQMATGAATEAPVAQGTVAEGVVTTVEPVSDESKALPHQMAEQSAAEAPVAQEPVVEEAQEPTPLADEPFVVEEPVEKGPPVVSAKGEVLPELSEGIVQDAGKVNGQEKVEWSPAAATVNMVEAAKGPVLVMEKATEEEGDEVEEGGKELHSSPATKTEMPISKLAESKAVLWPAVGQRIRVWFEEESGWIEGLVTKVTKPRTKRTKTGKVYVEYEDGDEGYCDFPEEGIEIMPAKDGQEVEVKDELPALRSKKAKTGMFDRVKIMLISANDS